MAMRRPIVLGVRGEAQSLVEAAGAGVCMEPENAQELADAVLRLAENPEEAAALGRSGRGDAQDA